MGGIFVRSSIMIDDNKLYPINLWITNYDGKLKIEARVNEVQKQYIYPDIARYGHPQNCLDDFVYHLHNIIEKARRSNSIILDPLKYQPVKYTLEGTIHESSTRF